MKTISIGNKDQHTFPITTIPALDEPLWKCSASFDQFSKVLKDQLHTHHVADLLPIVSEELSIETFSAYQEANKILAFVLIFLLLALPYVPGR